MAAREPPATDEPMSPMPSSELPQITTNPHSAVPNSSPALGTSASLAPVAGANTSPAAMLAASLVRSRATYFERLSSSSSSSCSRTAIAVPHEGAAASASSTHLTCPPTPRHSTTLASQPLHPLAPHPLSAVPRTGGGVGIGAAAAAASSWRRRDVEPQQQQQQQQEPQQRGRQQRQLQRRRRAPTIPQSPSAFSDLSAEDRSGGGGDKGRSDQDDGGGGDDSDDSDSVGTFFDKPSYTCYGAAVEMSQASFHGGGSGGGGAVAATDTAAAAAASGPTAAVAQYPGGSSAPVVAATAPPPPCGGEAGAVAPAAVGGLCSGSSGYVRSMSAHFARVSSGTGHHRGSGGGAAGMDGLFDDLVAHVGALLASHPNVETQMGMVQGLSDRLLQLHALCEMLGRKEDEVEHLRGVLRELTSTRAEAIRLKVQMAESLNGLQQEYYRVLRSAQLAQGTCKQHSARAAATRKQLLEVQGELLRYKRAVASLRDRNRRLRSENEDMAARLHVLDGSRLMVDAEGHRSACYMSLLQAQTPVLY